jgi:FlaA1/EpsC-like NDP-sugar epimerase
MENQPNLSKKSIMLNYGAILGFASIIVMLINYIVGDIYQPHWSLMIFSLAVTSTIIVFGLKKVKEMNSGFLSVGEAIKTGLGISLISALIYIVYLFIFYNMIEPDYFINMVKVQEQMIIERYPNLTDEQMEGAIKNAGMFANTGANLTLTMIVSLFFGLIISLIAGLVMKKTEEA